jgi:hypothetical protein
MKVNTYEAFAHISPFVVQHPLVKDYKKDTLQSIRCMITNVHHNPVMISAMGDNESIKIIARMIIDMIDPDTYKAKVDIIKGEVTEADIDYSHNAINLSSGNTVIQHKLKFVAGDSTFLWEWIFTDEAEVTA